MRLTAMVAMAAVAGWGVQCRLSAEDTRKVTVYLVEGSVLPGPVAVLAKAQVVEMFRTVGLKLDWRRYNHREAVTKDAIVIEAGNSISPRDHPGALAYATPYWGAHITVFYDRIEQTVASYEVTTLLAHVLVHEITHVLQGVSRHSETGVMKAYWDSQDYRRMAKGPLPFAEIDVHLIHRGLEARTREASGEPVVAGI